jgi:hypothetical protein
LTVDASKCIEGDVSSGLPSLCRTSLIAVVLLATGATLRAADAPANSDEKTVPVSVGGRMVPFRVKQQNDPLKHASFPDELDPRKVFSATNDMANKSYTADSVTLKKDSDFSNRDRNTFPTSAYRDSTLPDQSNSKTFTTSKAFTKSAHDYNKSFSTTTANLGSNQPAVLSQNPTSDDQNRTAVLGGPDKQEVLASNDMTHKQYLGPGAQKVPDGVAIKDNLILTRMSGVPDRPLSIDEVRNLINHGTVPDTTEKPDAPSKPLNDPNYQPEPLRDIPAPIPGGNPKEDDESAIPEPGTMSLVPPPENSQPLPQR